MASMASDFVHGKSYKQQIKFFFELSSNVSGKFFEKTALFITICLLQGLQ
jgi:hypothetical protein